MAETFPVQGLAQRCGQLAYGRHADFASGGMELSQKEMTMPKMSAANRKRISEMKAAARRGKMLQAKRTGERKIPDKVIRFVGSLGLPNNPWVYNVVLAAALEREANGV